MAQKINKRYYNTREGLQFAATSAMINSVLLMVAVLFWTYIYGKIFSGSSGGIASALSYISPVLNFVSAMMLYTAFKKEQDALTMNGEKPDKAVKAITMLVIVLTFLTLALMFVYNFLNGRLTLMTSQTTDETALYKISVLGVRVGVIINILGKILAPANAVAVFAAVLYIREQENVRLHYLALACVLITVLSIILITINYCLQYFGKSSVAYSTIANLTVFFTYGSMYLMLESRNQKLKAFLDSPENA